VSDNLATPARVRGSGRRPTLTISELTFMPCHGPIGRVSLAALAIVICWWAAESRAAEPVRVATFNLALYGRQAAEILERLQAGDDPQACALAEIIQRVRPDVLVLNEIDYDGTARLSRRFG
jgi:hypothetical protein